MERDLLYREINLFADSEIHLFDSKKYTGSIKEKSFLRNDDLKTKQSINGKELFFAQSEFVEVLAANNKWFKVEGKAMMTDKGIDIYFTKPGSTSPSKVTGWIKGAGINIKGPYKLPERSIKFEIQTPNYVRRTDGTKKSEWHPLPRKFGPEENKYLCVGVKGSLPKFEIKDGKVYKKEGTAVELQSEEGGFIEFETPNWFQKWSNLKKRVKEAKEMCKKLNDLSGVTMDIKVWDSHSPTGFYNFKDAKIVKFPPEFNIDHLKKGTFQKGQKKLSSKEYLEVAIVDDTWSSGIQISEAIELTQFDSLLNEYDRNFISKVKTITTTVLTKANSAKLPLSSLTNLTSFLQIIVYYILRGQKASLVTKIVREKGETDATKDKKENCLYKLAANEILVETTKRSPAKFAFKLMCRTSFSSMFSYLLNTQEQDLFKYIVLNKLMLNELGYNNKTQFFICGHGGSKDKPTIEAWLQSILKPSNGKDLLSHGGGIALSAAMGKFDIEKQYGNWDKVRFELRGVYNVKLDDWIKNIQDYFKTASLNRGTVGTDRLIYDP